jgi:hypothetical protein
VQMRNGSAPKGIDLGPASPAVAPRYSGSFISSLPVGIDPLSDDHVREKGRFAYKPVGDPQTEHRREQWRRAQQKRREKAPSRSLGDINV